MSIQVKLSAVRQTRWYEYLIRFLFGGALTAATGLITHRYGPVVGGLFLAFPSIFPASVTLVQTHKARKERAQGESKETSQQEGIQSAGRASEGTALGSFGLLAFALVIWQLAEKLPPALVLILALLGWFGVGFLSWWLYERLRPAGRQDTSGEAG